MSTLSLYPNIFSKIHRNIFILEVGHLTNSIPMNNIEEHIHIIHTRSRQKYALIGFIIHAGLHFFMRTCLRGEWYIYDGIKSRKLRLKVNHFHTCQLSRFWRDVPLFHSSIESIFSSVPLLLEISLLCPAFLYSMYSTFLLCPAMSREIQRCVPL